MKRLVLGLTLGFAFSLSAQAQYFPTKPVRVIVPHVAGGASDILARLIIVPLRDQWTHSPIFENKRGASSILGNDFVAKANSDGHKLVAADLGTLTIAPSLAKNMPFDLHKDLAPVTTLTFSPPRRM